MFNLSRPGRAQLNMPLTMSTPASSRDAKISRAPNCIQMPTATRPDYGGIWRVVTYRPATSWRTTGLAQPDPIVFDGFGHKLYINLYASLLLGRSALGSLCAHVHHNTADFSQISWNATTKRAEGSAFVECWYVYSRSFDVEWDVKPHCTHSHSRSFQFTAS